MELEKTTIKEYFVCGNCEKKMENIRVCCSGDLFSFSVSIKNFMYCDNKECDKFGYLTVGATNAKE